MELAHGAGRWSLEPGAWSLEPGAWSLESGAGAWSTWSWSLAHGACDSDVTGSTLISLKYFYFPLQHFPLQRCNGNEPYFTSNVAIPVTSCYTAVRYTHRHLIHMNSPVPRFGPGSVQGRLDPEHLDTRHSPARSVLASKRALIGSISTSTRAGVEPELLANRTGHHQVEPTVSFYWF